MIVSANFLQTKKFYRKKKDFLPKFLIKKILVEKYSDRITIHLSDIIATHFYDLISYNQPHEVNGAIENVLKWLVL